MLSDPCLDHNNGLKFNLIIQMNKPKLYLYAKDSRCGSYFLTLEVAPGDLVPGHPVGGPPGQADGVDLDVHHLHLPHRLDQLRLRNRR